MISVCGAHEDCVLDERNWLPIGCAEIDYCLWNLLPTIEEYDCPETCKTNWTCFTNGNYALCNPDEYLMKIWWCPTDKCKQGEMCMPTVGRKLEKQEEEGDYCGASECAPLRRSIAINKFENKT